MRIASRTQRVGEHHGAGQRQFPVGAIGAKAGAADRLGVADDVDPVGNDVQGSGQSARRLEPAGRNRRTAGLEHQVARQRDHQAVIERCFSARSVESILAALDAAGDDWAAKVARIIRKQSPTSLKVTFEQLERGASLDFDQAMVQEYRMSQAFMAGKDFYEGIRALLVDKDRAPKWSPASLAEVTPALIERHFAPLGDKDLVFS